MLIADMINENYKILFMEQSLAEALNLLLLEGMEGVPVVDEDNKLVGLITNNHLLKALAAGLPRETPVENIMSRNFIFVHEDDQVDELLKKDIKQPFLPVVNERKRPAGIIRSNDLIQAFIDYSQKVLGELNTILESARNAIVAIDTAGKITIFNRAAAEIVGIASEKAMGKPIEEILPNTGLLDVLETGEAQIAKKFKISDKMVISNRSPLLKEGKIAGAIGFFQDISDLESISKELKYTRDLNRELDTIIEAVSDGLYITDGKGYTTRINSSYEKISGIKADEVIGRHMQELVDEGYYSESVTLHVLKERKPVTITHEIRTGIEVMVTGTPVFDEDGNIVRVVTTVRDMEALSKMKRELQESKKLTARYYNELEQLRLQQLELDDVIFESPVMREILEQSLRLGQFNSTVLITGESGVGKEIVARVIHKASQSEANNGSLIKVNCGAIPDNLLESELFGYEKGAFTGAKRQGKPGLFELAENGTLFLDEVAELPINMQVKLLRALQEREFMRVGGTKPIKINTRIIAATNKNLEEMVSAGKFREDLYYRLNVVPIYVPPLRERKEDITPLILHFLSIFNNRFETNKKMSLDLMDYLTKYDWPGNVRQLKNTIERMVVMVSDDIITIKHLPAEISKEIENGGDIAALKLDYNLDLQEAVKKVEKKILVRAMNKAKTTREIAELIGVSQPTVVRKIKKYKLNNN